MKNIKLGYQAPVNYRTDSFRSISIEGDFGHCVSHNFLYNVEEEKRKLYYAEPCFYTDSRYKENVISFYKETNIFMNGKKPISLNSCKRRTLQCKNIPVGTIVKFDTMCYVPGTDFDLSYLFKIKKENYFEPNYEINEPTFFNNFKNCDFSKNLTDSLRNNGFIVQVWNTNPDFLVGEDEGGEFAIAYGYGKKIGYSSHNNTFRGYSNGQDNILWDKLGEFDKWSRCNKIAKTENILIIIDTLITE